MDVEQRYPDRTPPPNKGRALLFALIAVAAFVAFVLYDQRTAEQTNDGPAPIQVAPAD